MPVLPHMAPLIFVISAIIATIWKVLSIKFWHNTMDKVTSIIKWQFFPAWSFLGLQIYWFWEKNSNLHFYHFSRIIDFKNKSDVLIHCAEFCVGGEMWGAWGLHVHPSRTAKKKKHDDTFGTYLNSTLSFKSAVKTNST